MVPTFKKSRTQLLRDMIDVKEGMDMTRTADKLYEEREKRLRDAIQLKEPDRVPVLFSLGYFPAVYNSMPTATAFYDIVAWKEACHKTIVDFAPDLYWMASGESSGVALEALDSKRTKWPGYNLPPDVSHQALEGESLREDEWDLFLADPSDFILRRHLPRVFGVLAPFARLPSLRSWGGGLPTTMFVTPEFQQAFEAIFKAGRETAKQQKVMSTFDDEMAALGFPPYRHGVANAPFDALSNTYRGLRGSMIDMYRRPEKLLEAIEMFVPLSLERAAATAASRKRGNPKRVVLPLHKGAEGFMSLKQFETFYWPTFKKVLLSLMDLGLVPMPFFEGEYTSRLEYLLELPKGKAVCHFAYIDIARAKAVLGGHLCMVGSVPPSLLAVGSAQEVEEYCRDLIEVAGKGGGFILANASADEAKPENIKAMIDAAKKYRTY
ncbi:MAG: hypothetical protein HY667_01270 [Chloroflexi bacterium]|nr:hypothetical protein [Chloroflexota bacterium]